MIIPFILIVLNYFMGSISSAILIAKWVKGVDIRKEGYKTAGGSNVSRVIGVKWGLVVAAFDLLKGIPVLLIAQYLNVDNLWYVPIACAAVLGHNWPIWFGFSGGRGLGTVFGTMMFLTPNQSIIPVITILLSLHKTFFKDKIDNKWFGSPVFTLLALANYLIITMGTDLVFDDLLAISYIFIVILRRITARFDEYKKYPPLKLFFSRLIFDDNVAA